MKPEMLETKEARKANFKVPKGKPYGWVPIGGGMDVGVRLKKSGVFVWVVRKLRPDKSGNYDQPLKGHRLVADSDSMPADGKRVLNYQQLVRLANGGVTPGKPIMVAEALAAYTENLKDRKARLTNATQPLYHLENSKRGPMLLTTALVDLDDDELAAWCRELLDDGMKPSTLKRMLKGLMSALNFIAEKPKHKIKNANVWKVAFKPFVTGVNDYSEHDKALTHEQIEQLLKAAYARSEQFGLVVQMLVVTGVRRSQALKPLVKHLDVKRSRVYMPSSCKRGGGRITRTEVWAWTPIPPAFARKLAAHVAGRPQNAPLLVWGDGKPWLPSKLRADFAKVAKTVGLKNPEDGQLVTGTWLRHSYFTNTAEANPHMDREVLAGSADTSERMLKKTYIKIGKRNEAEIRAARFDYDAPPADGPTPPANVVPMRKVG